MSTSFLLIFSVTCIKLMMCHRFHTARPFSHLRCRHFKYLPLQKEAQQVSHGTDPHGSAAFVHKQQQQSWEGRYKDPSSSPFKRQYDNNHANKLTPSSFRTFTMQNVNYLHEDNDDSLFLTKNNNLLYYFISKLERSA